MSDFKAGHVPPTGLRPAIVLKDVLAVKILEYRDRHRRLRIEEILDAIKRYVAANEPVPNDWIKELRSLTK